MHGRMTITSGTDATLHQSSKGQTTMDEFGLGLLCDLRHSVLRVEFDENDDWVSNSLWAIKMLFFDISVKCWLILISLYCCIQRWTVPLQYFFNSKVQLDRLYGIKVYQRHKSFADRFTDGFKMAAVQRIRVPWVVTKINFLIQVN